MKKEDIIDFKLVNFIIGKSSFTIPPGNITKATKGGYSLKSQIIPDMEKDILLIKIFVELNIKYKKENVRLGLIETGSFYSIKDIKRFFHNDKPNFPPNFIEMLLSVSISSSRGAFVARSLCMNLPTPFATMPLVKPSELVPDNWKVETEN